MNNSSVTIIDYGVGNLLSVKRGFEYFGAEVIVTSNPDVILSSPRVVLPGVGAFSRGMEELHKNGLVEVIQEFATKERPILGICLGMQMLLSESEEFGRTEGLGLIPGVVKKISVSKGIKIPHIGWNRLKRTSLESGNNSIVNEIKDEDEFYFVHSFMACPEDKLNVQSTCSYAGVEITASVKKNNVMGCQFHPEKSGMAGLQILKRFLTLQ